MNPLSTTRPTGKSLPLRPQEPKRTRVDAPRLRNEMRNGSPRWIDASDEFLLVVSVNSTVKLKDLKSGAIRICTIVDPQWHSLVPGALSVLGPLGHSLVGSRPGDIIECWELSFLRLLEVDAILLRPNPSAR